MQLFFLNKNVLISATWIALSNNICDSCLSTYFSSFCLFSTLKPHKHNPCELWSQVQYDPDHSVCSPATVETHMPHAVPIRREHACSVMRALLLVKISLFLLWTFWGSIFSGQILVFLTWRAMSQLTHSFSTSQMLFESKRMLSPPVCAQLRNTLITFRNCLNMVTWKWLNNEI